MCTITCIDDYWMINNLCCILFGTFLFVTHNNSIKSHSFYCEKRITKAFTFDDTAGAGSDIYYICAQIFSCSFK